MARNKKKSSYSNADKEWYAIHPRNFSQQLLMESIRNNKVTIAIGSAGVGKTLIALYEACKMYRQGHIDKIYYLRNDVGMKSLGSIPRGALPGDEFEKAKHLLHPITDNIGDVMNYNKAKFMIENKIIEPIIFDDIRGRSLSNCFVLVDECQNVPPVGVKTALTRLDRTCKIVLSGDPGQKDSSHKYQDGLSHAAKVLSDLDFVGTVYFTDEDIERDPCNTEIIRRYRNDNC